MRTICLTILLLFGIAIGHVRAADSISFRSQIAPILLDNCLACHGPKKAEGGYRVDSYEELKKAGDSGESPIAATAEETSELLRRLTCDESERMPADSDPLEPAQIELIKGWIAAGATFDGSDPTQTLALVIPPAQYPASPSSYRHAVPVASAIFSPDGTQIIAGGYHEITIWNAGDGQLVRRIGNIGQRVFALSFAPDGRTLAVGCGEPGKNGEVRFVNFETGEITGVAARTSDVVLDVAYRPGTAELAVAAADSLIRVINTETLAEIRTIASHADWVTALAWSDDGSRLASASRDKSVKIYDGASGELLSSYLGHAAAVRGVSILADGKQVVSAGADQKLHRWDIEGAKKVAELKLGGEGAKLVRRDNFVWVPCTDKRVRQIDLSNNTIAKTFEGHADWVLVAQLAPMDSTAGSGRVLLTSAIDGELRLWNESDGTFVRGWLAKP